MSPPATLLVPNTTSPALLFSTSHILFNKAQQNLTKNPTFFKKTSTSLPLSSHSLQFSLQNGTVEEEENDDNEELIIGDCLVFEEGIFDDPFLQDESFNTNNNPKGRGKGSNEVEPENLIPEKWINIQKEINITKKERRKLAQQLEFGRKVEKKRAGLRPIASGNLRSVNVEEFMKYRDEKLKQLNPIVLDKPGFTKYDERREKGDDEVRASGSGRSDSSNSSSSSSRVAPRNPRLAVYGGGLEDISKFFSSGKYDPDAAKNADGI